MFSESSTDASADHPTATMSLLEVVRIERQRLQRDRFQGRDPVVSGPSGKTATRIVARLIAADREGALVRLAEEAVNPAEDRAEEALQAAIDALTTWSFDRFNRELAIAGRFAHEPARQQRTSALRALGALLRALVVKAPGERLGTERAALDRLLPALDELAAGERDHYGAEARRLYTFWQEAVSAPAAWRRWALLRAQLAIRCDADESALAWSIRAWDRERPATFAADSAVATLVEAARRSFAGLIDPASVPQADEEPLRPREVVHAVSAAIFAHDEGDDARDPFAFVPYHPPSAPGEQPV